jgi:hypothetical protein
MARKHFLMICFVFSLSLSWTVVHKTFYFYAIYSVWETPSCFIKKGNVQVLSMHQPSVCGRQGDRNTNTYYPTVLIDEILSLFC